MVWVLFWLVWDWLLVVVVVVVVVAAVVVVVVVVVVVTGPASLLRPGLVVTVLGVWIKGTRGSIAQTH